MKKYVAAAPLYFPGSKHEKQKAEHMQTERLCNMADESSSNYF